MELKKNCWQLSQNDIKNKRSLGYEQAVNSVDVHKLKLGHARKKFCFPSLSLSFVYYRAALWIIYRLNKSLHYKTDHDSLVVNRFEQLGL